MVLNIFKAIQIKLPDFILFYFFLNINLICKGGL